MQYEYFMRLWFHEQDSPKMLQISEGRVEKESAFIKKMMADTNRPFWKEASIVRRQVGEWETVYESSQRAS